MFACTKLSGLLHQIVGVITGIAFQQVQAVAAMLFSLIYSEGV